MAKKKLSKKAHVENMWALYWPARGKQGLSHIGFSRAMLRKLSGDCGLISEVVRVEVRVI